MNRRERSQVLLDQWLDGGLIKAAHKHESKVTGIGETIFVESHRLIEVPTVDCFDRVKTSAQMVLISRGHQSALEIKLRNHTLIGKHSFHLRRLGTKCI